MFHPKPYDHVALTLSTSRDTISLSTNPATPIPFQLNVTARITASSAPATAITLLTNGSALDNGQHTRHDGLFWGAFLPLQNITDPERRISHAHGGSPNYGSYHAPPNLRKQDWNRFETVPVIGKGELIIKHNVSLEQMFLCSHALKASDLRPGEKYRIRMSPRRLIHHHWWTIGSLDDGGEGGLRDKTSVVWELPDEGGEIWDLVPGEEAPDVREMKDDGWVFSNGFAELRVTDESEDDMVVKFTG